MAIECLICKNQNLKEIRHSSLKKYYFFCDSCQFHFLAPEFHLDQNLEKARYQEHENDYFDLGYQEFQKSLLKHSLPLLKSQARILDYGCGKTPILSHLLIEMGHEVDQYDPFFYPELELMESRYDVILSVEVVEHFKNPCFEFERVQSFLKPGGWLIAKTHLWTGQNLFDWYYSKDPTHLSFYSEKTLKVIQSKLNWQKLNQFDQRHFALQRQSVTNQQKT